MHCNASQSDIQKGSKCMCQEKGMEIPGLTLILLSHWFLPVHPQPRAFPDLLYLCLPGPKGLTWLPDPQLCSDHQCGDTSLVLTSSPVCSLYPKNRNFFWLFQSQANYAAPHQQRLLKIISEFIIKTITPHIYILLFKLSLFLRTSSFTLTKSPWGRHDRYQLITKLGQRKEAHCRAKMKLLGFLTCVSFPQETCLLSICYFPS